MADDRRRGAAPPSSSVVLAALGLALLTLVMFSVALAAAPPAHLPPASASAAGAERRVAAASLSSGGASVEPVGTPPSEVTVGAPTDFSWEAVNASGDRITGFAVDCDLTFQLASNGSTAPVWVNSTGLGPLDRSPNGTVAVPPTAWDAGVLNLSITFAESAPVVVQLSGPLLPSTPPPAEVAVLPDLDHLVLYAHEPPSTATVDGVRSNATFWLVHDRFGNPAPGAWVTIVYSLGGIVTRTVEPVVLTTGGATGAWVNYSAPDSEAATLTVLDAAGTVLFGPVDIPTNTSGGPAPVLSPLALAGVLLLSAGGLGGIGALLLGGRPRGPKEPTEAEEELRRLAEGRAAVVELLRRSGPLSLGEIESGWDPPPAPPALSDWVASLVTDGTLTASLEGEGRARFALARKPAAEPPRVTLDEDALERGIARRDAAVEDEEEDARAP